MVIWPGNMVIQNRQKIVFSKYCPLKESHWSCFPKVSMRKLRNYTGAGAGAGGGGEGGGGGLGERLRGVQRHVQLQHQRGLPGAAAPGQVQYLHYIYAISTLSTYYLLLSTGRVWSRCCRAGAWSLTALRTLLITGTPGDWAPT